MSLTRQVREGAIVRIRHGGYVDTRADDVRERHRQLIAATWPLFGPDTVLSHASAAVLHGLPAWDAQLAGVSAVRPAGGHGRKGRFLHVRVAALPPGDVVERAGYRTTSLERTAIDQACVLRFDRAVATLDAALHLGADPASLAAVVADARRRHGVGVARAALRFADGRSESVGESLSRVLMAQVGLPAPELQVDLHDRHGVWIARSDFGWLDHWVIGEFDGRVKYLGTPEEVARTVMREKAREQAIRDAGWTVVRWTWTDLGDPVGFRSRIESALALAARGRLAS